MLGLLHLIGLTAGQPYAFRPVPPLGVPAVLSAAFWGGVWGIVFAAVHNRFPRGSAKSLGDRSSPECSGTQLPARMQIPDHAHEK